MVQEVTPDTIKAIRSRLGLTQPQLAALLTERLELEAGERIAANTVYRWEAGLYPPHPYLRALLRSLAESES